MQMIMFTKIKTLFLRTYISKAQKGRKYRWIEISLEDVEDDC
jgi:hypothetical protein